MAGHARVRLAVALGTALIGVAALAGCGSDDDGSTNTSQATSFPTTDTAEVADPCEAMDTAELASLIGVDELTATADGAANYRGCSYTDTATDTVVLTSTTYASSADFDAVWSSVAADIESPTSELSVPGATARMITAESEASLALTGVAAGNGVVDLVNLLVNAPYDTAQQTAAVTALLTAMVAASAS